MSVVCAEVINSCPCDAEGFRAPIPSIAFPLNLGKLYIVMLSQGIGCATREIHLKLRLFCNILFPPQNTILSMVGCVCNSFLSIYKWTTIVQEIVVVWSCKWMKILAVV